MMQGSRDSAISLTFFWYLASSSALWVSKISLASFALIIFFISYWLCILFVEGIGFIALLATLGFMTSWDLLPSSVGLDL
jgi:hypothetical protein